MATQREQDSTTTGHQSDEDMLAALGYKQELHRGMSGFSNFAVSPDDERHTVALRDC